MDRKKSLRILTQTAMMLAVTLVMQYVAGILPIPAGMVRTLVIGSLVNLSLLVTTQMVGWRGSMIVSVLTPLVALWIGQLPLPHMFPIVAVANVIMVLLFEFLGRRSQVLALAVAAIVKTAVSWILVVYIFVPYLLPAIGLPEAKVATMTAMLSLNFTWPQLVTAVVGGILAMAVAKPLARFRVEQERE